MLSERVNARRIINFGVNDDVHLSDYRLITFDINFISNKDDNASRMNIHPLDEWKFSMNIRNLLISLKHLDSNNINEAIYNLENGVRKIYNNAKLRKGKKNNAPW